MMTQEYKLGGFFQEFYVLLVDLHKRFGNGRDPECVQTIQHAIIELMADQTKRVSADDERFAESYCHKVHYAMVAFADEFFISLDWSKKSEWLELLLERRVFKTHNAGSAVFDDIEEVLASKTNVDAALVYLKVLGLGFTGKHAKNQKYLQQLKAKLFSMVHHASPTLDIKEIFTNANVLVTVESEVVAKKRDSTLVWYSIACCVV